MAMGVMAMAMAMVLRSLGSSLCVTVIFAFSEKRAQT